MNATPARVSSENYLRTAIVRSTLINLGLSVLLKIFLFVQSIILARIFAPADIGLFTTVMMTVSLVMLLGQFGGEQAIIRHRGDESVFLMVDTALALSLIISAILFVTLFLIAPFLANWVKQPKITIYIRFLSFFAFGSGLAIPSALWIKNFHFGKAKIPLFADSAVSLGTTLLLFYLFNLGIWSLFYGKLAGFLANYGSLWVLAPYRPGFRLNWQVAKSMLEFGWPLLVNGVCNYVVWQGDQWLILYFWGKEQLAYYVLAFSLSFYLKELVDMASGALFPFLSRLQDETHRMSSAFCSSNKYLAIMIVPIGVSLYIFAPLVIGFIYTEKWINSIPILKVFALAIMVNVLMGYNWGLLVVTSGRTKYLMYTNLWIILLLCTVGVYMVQKFGPIGGCLFMFFQTILTTLLFRLPIIRSEIKSLSFLKEIWKPLLCGGLSGAIISVLLIPFISSFAHFLGGIIIYGGLYVILLILVDRKIIQETKYLSRIAFSMR